MQNTKKLNEINPREIKNILIIKQHNQLGDMLCTYPFFAAVKSVFSNAFITLVASKDNFGIIDANGDNYIDNSILFEKFTPVKLLKFTAKLKKRKYDIAFVPSTVSFSKTSHLIAKMSGAPVRIGVSSSCGRENQYASYLTHGIEIRKSESNLHQVHKFLKLIDMFPESNIAGIEQSTKLNFSIEEKRFAKNYLNEHFGSEKMIIGFHPGAGKIPNRWNVENFVKLINMLSDYLKFSAIVTGIKKESDVTSVLIGELQAKKIKCSLLEGYSIRKTASVLADINLYITNDTGTMHVAAYSGTKVLSLFGPTPGKEWAPLFANCRFIQSGSDDINTIEPGQVFNNAISMIK